MRQRENRRGSLPNGNSTTDLWRIPIVRTRRTSVHQGSPPPGKGRRVTIGVSCSRRPPLPICPWAATAIPPPAASPAGRSGRRSRCAPTAAGGTPQRPPTSPSTAGTWATWTSCGVPRGCARPTRACSGRSPAAACWRSAAVRPPAHGGCGGREPTSLRWISPPGCCPGGGTQPGDRSRRAAAAGRRRRPPAGEPDLRRRLLGVRRPAVRHRRRRGDGGSGAGAAAGRHGSWRR